MGMEFGCGQRGNEGVEAWACVLEKSFPLNFLGGGLPRIVLENELEIIPAVSENTENQNHNYKHASM